MDRKALIMAEFHTYPSDSMYVKEFMNLSERALKIREDRRKAAVNGQTYVN
jgi:hypothetical protein